MFECNIPHALQYHTQYTVYIIMYVLLPTISLHNNCPNSFIFARVFHLYLDLFFLLLCLFANLFPFVCDGGNYCHAHFIMYIFSSISLYFIILLFQDKKGNEAKQEKKKKKKKVGQMKLILIGIIFLFYVAFYCCVSC